MRAHRLRRESSIASPCQSSKDHVKYASVANSLAFPVGLPTLLSVLWLWYSQILSTCVTTMHFKESRSLLNLLPLSLLMVIGEAKFIEANRKCCTKMRNLF